MSKGQRIRRMGAAALCLLFAVSWFGALLLSASHAGHGCVHVHCAVCSVVCSNRLLRLWVLVALCVLALSVNGALCMAWRTRSSVYSAPSLVTCKVKFTC